MSRLTKELLDTVCEATCKATVAAGWTFHAVPCVSWQFATVEDFKSARNQIFAALALSEPTLYFPDTSTAAAHLQEDIDYRGVVFRLVCEQRNVKYE